MPSDKEIYEFTLLLRHFQLYKPEELYKVICPFHNDKNASMQISIPKAFYYCYGCGAKGSSLELFKAFYEQTNNTKITELQAALKLTKLLKVLYKQDGKSYPLHTYDSSYSYTSNIYSTFNNTNASVATDTFPNFLSVKNFNKISYKEGIQTAKEYYENLPTPNWYKTSLVPSVTEESIMCKRYMHKRGFSATLLKQVGAKPSLNKYYPIIFPLLENGIFRGYVMRTFDKQIEQERKYMYNRGFKRERVLVGTYGKRHTGFDTVLLVEGFLDSLKARAIGIPFVVAILGWKISATHLEKLKRAGIKQIVCGFDNDASGRKGYEYLKLVQKQQKWFKLYRIRYPKSMKGAKSMESTKDFGEINKGTKEAERILEQLRNIVENF